MVRVSLVLIFDLEKWFLVWSFGGILKVLIDLAPSVVGWVWQGT